MFFLKNEIKVDQITVNLTVAEIHSVKTGCEVPIVRRDEAPSIIHDNSGRHRDSIQFSSRGSQIEYHRMCEDDFQQVLEGRKELRQTRVL